MKFGFVIDNRKCIGCHACTTACKSEHDVAVGVNRTWVKQTEKGEYPNTRRLFSVLRCNHCTDAPCVEICPVEALYTRDDGIVDFNNDRCIGCKSCMQACPYDALYIDPKTETAAKCNYCAHRVDIGLEPACVNVCPEHAIISGDMDNPHSEISEILAREQVTVRKPEKGTGPNVFYIDGDFASLTPSETERSSEYMWGNQTAGVGHYAKFAEKIINGKSLAEMTMELSGKEATFAGKSDDTPQKSVNVIMERGGARRVYDTPDKGILWGWEVSAYILTKAIAAGAFLVPFFADEFGFSQINGPISYLAIAIGLLFLGLTGVFLVKDLDKPRRFAYVLLRPQWNSWLVRGGYAITFFGAFLTLTGLGMYLDWGVSVAIFARITALFAIFVAVYTAFLFAQAKGRDFWQSPMLVVHMFLHSIMAGAAVFLIADMYLDSGAAWTDYLDRVLFIAIGVNLVIMWIELTITHPTQDAKRVVSMIVSGRYKTAFWGGSLLVGNVIPIILLTFGGIELAAVAGVLILVGIYITESIWVEAPQRIQLT